MRVVLLACLIALTLLSPAQARTEIHPPKSIHYTGFLCIGTYDPVTDELLDYYCEEWWSLRPGRGTRHR